MLRVLVSLMDPTSLAYQKINSLTEDEDHRQNLWIHFLSGNPLDTLTAHLELLKKESILSNDIEKRILGIIRNSHYNKFQEILANFSNYEQGIICLIALGLSIKQISSVRGISEIRIKQTISAIRYNPYWNTLYGVEKELNGRRKIRSNRRRD